MASITSFLRGNHEDDRGRTADRPTEIPARGWKDVLTRVKADIKRDDVTLLSAGVAFYALLSLVPGLVALVSVYGLVADPADIQRNIDDMLAAAPKEVQELVSSQLSDIVESSPSGLRLGALVGLVVALWSASSGVKNLMTAVNRAYHEDETRGFFKLRGTAIFLTIALVAIGAVGLGVVVAPAALDSGGALGVARDVLGIVRWPIAALLILVGLALIYRFGPDRDNPRWGWASTGAIVAAVLWLAASIGFSFYTANFGSYNETYGALGAIVVVMLWLWISAFAIITGAELNGESERQTVSDTTTGGSKPLGERDAYAADTIGPEAGEVSDRS
ncbi:MAG TPA: YihY/virulence factor BrkB family protein [Acidimicrobiales bacterium]|nr:YihY/virulence factor BrkB family protein [Acidimicrobiales bacterium]